MIHPQQTQKRRRFLRLWGGALALLAHGIHADPPPPGIGQYLDRNGDGRADSVLVRFQSPVEGCYRMRFSLCGSSWEMRLDSMEVDSSHQVFSGALPSDPTPPLGPVCTEVDPSSDFLDLLDTATDSVVSSLQMSDRLPPVILSARLRQSDGPGESDTLEVQTSEPVRFDRTGGAPLLRTGGGSDPGIPLVYRSLMQIGQTKLVVFIDSGSNFLPTDSIRLSPWAIQDAYGNAPSLLLRYTAVEGTRQTTRIRFVRTRIPRSGGAGYDILGRSPGAGSKPRILDSFWSPDLRFPR